MTTLLWVFTVLLGLRLGAELWLDFLNRKEVRAHADQPPEAFAGIMEPETYQKAVRYTLEGSRFGSVQTAWDSLLLALVVLTGFLPWLYEAFTGLLGTGLWGQALVLFAVVMLLGLPSLPFEWYEQFRLEEKYGFNRSTLKLWLTDKVKGLIIGLLIGLPLLALLIWFYRASVAGDWLLPWWLWGFVLLFTFQLLMLVLYPMFILPLFNKLEPLEEGDLRERLMTLADRTGFAAKTIQVMDGSRRSSHSNAFFTGFGRFRRIVLYDTLIEQLQPRELEAVLAHEIGHYKLGHIPKMLGMSAALSLGAFALIGWLVGQAWFFTGFGFDFTTGQMMVPTLLLFSLCSGLIGFWLSPLTNILSRKHEYEADAFAREAMGAPEPLRESLRKLHEKNLSNLTPHRLYSFMHYSHPTLTEREAALMKG